MELPTDSKLVAPAWRMYIVGWLIYMVIVAFLIQIDHIFEARFSWWLAVESVWSTVPPALLLALVWPVTGYLERKGKRRPALIGVHLVLGLTFAVVSHLQLLMLMGEEPKLPEIVFTTAYDQYAVIAFELNAVDYLLKPFTRARFDAAVARLMEDAPGQPQQVLTQALAQAALRGPSRLERVLVRDRGRIFPLAVGDIEYMKSDSKYTAIVARGQSFLVRIGISELEAQLDPARFIRIHRSANSMKADDQSQRQIRMRDGTCLGANREASKVLREMAI
jgi:two-component system LytT family response regulator